MNITCANCEEPIIREPVYQDGEPFCCSGCANGGPCICTYLEGAATGAEALAASADAVQAEPPPPEPAASQPLAWPTPEHVRTAPLRRPAILRVTGLAHQSELLRFGYAIEQQPEIEDLSLVRADLDDVWFAVAVRDPDALAEALVRIPGFEVDARPHPAGVDATVRVVAPAATAAPAPEAPRAAVTPPAALTARPRFRLFHRGPEPAQPAVAAAGSPPQPVAPPLVPSAAAARPAEPRPRGDMLAADARPGGAIAMRGQLTLVVYPFRSFATLNEFQEAVRALHGVISVQVRRFYRGTLHLGVDYEDVIPMLERLRDLHGFPWQLVSDSAQEIELMLEEQGDLVSSG